MQQRLTQVRVYSMVLNTLRGLGDPEYEDSELPRLGGGARPLV